MKIFLDTANLAQIKEAQSLGLLDGVTTNPSLMAKENIQDAEEYRRRIRQICEWVDGPVSAECVTATSEEMVREGRELSEIHPNVVVKVPLIKNGLIACQRLHEEGIRVNVTLCFTALQAWMAAKAGATFISPFVGRLDDVGEDGMNLIRDIKTIYGNYHFKTEILVASVRHPIHVLEAARIGADVVTLPFDVLEKLMKHPLTDIGQARFLKDWEQRPLKATSKKPAASI
ncbi:MAG: fructose-6-phosphate aldolase [Candidatus Omnitrophica bacterium]|nr:fructose-6-phosphate aldolase [Candidatus Omnitrophota bacterium]